MSLGKFASGQTVSSPGCSMNQVTSVCVYCASSRQADQEYAQSARRLGEILGELGVTLIYGGGAVGSMGAVADGALSRGGRVLGILPRFMDELEWGHPGISELCLVDSMAQRKQQMIDRADALIALPGGSGTLEELLEALTWKRLGLHGKPIVIVNTRDFYAPLLAMLEHTIEERFMDVRHRDMWTVVRRVEEVLPAIREMPLWDPEARRFAAL